MRRFNKWMIVIVLLEMIACGFGVFLLMGCVSTSPQPIIHPEAGTHLMLIPKGTQIGEQVAPENGIYIGESLTRPPQPIQEQQELKAKKKSWKMTTENRFPDTAPQKRFLDTAPQKRFFRNSLSRIVLKSPVLEAKTSLFLEVYRGFTKVVNFEKFPIEKRERDETLRRK